MIARGRVDWSRRFGIVGQSRAMQRLLVRAERAAECDIPVLITGETGTGKELLARAIHGSSSRSAGPFVSEACGALPQGLLESELFGHEEGAFTGASEARAGLFERASGGTLFIDELGDTSEALQAKLLRVLQEGQVRRLGGSEPVSLDVRLIASTQQDLVQLVREGGFRRDLLYRVAVLELEMPPLRERIEDVPLLAEHFLERIRGERGCELSLSQAALDRLLEHDWPGNVRELENAVRVGALFQRSGAISPEALQLEGARETQTESADARISYQDLLDQLSARERDYLEAVLRRCDGNKARAARRLGVTRYALRRSLKRLGLLEEELVGATSS